MTRQRPHASRIAPSQRTVVVTGTDTGVGKTTATALWLAALRANGINAAYWKPLETGVATDSRPVWPATTVDGGDPGRVAAVAGGAPVYAGLRLPEPLAPVVAAARACVRIDVAAIVAGGRSLAAQHDILLVEGAGGLTVELTPAYDFRDLARDLGAVVALVVGNRLGCLNHAHLTWQALGVAGLPRTGWILNETAPPQPADVSRAHNVEQLTRLLGRPPLAHVAYAAKPPQHFAPLCE